MIIEIEQLSKIYKLYPGLSARAKEILYNVRLKFKSSSSQNSQDSQNKYYHKVLALNQINLKIAKGETVGIIGKNGSGKSTLLKIITGIVTPTCGRINVRGKISALLELGAGLSPELTGKENIYFNGSLQGLLKKEIDKKFSDIANFADIGPYLDRPLKYYSSGMFVRLAFSIATHVSPDILIVDEALAVGDISFQYKCFCRFNQFKEQGKTILFVTHSLDQIIQYCDRAIVLDGGEIICDSTPKEAVDAYKQIISGVNARAVVEKTTLIGVGGAIAAAAGAAIGTAVEATAVWKEKFANNPSSLSYGDKRATIYDYGLFDHKHQGSTQLINEEYFYIKFKIKFDRPTFDPIFAFTIKDLKGMEIFGTNTLYEQNKLNGSHLHYKEGDIVIVEFKQLLNLRSGNYSLSIGCTALEGDNLVVYDRLYDIILFEVIAFKQFVGFYDPKSALTITAI